ncbi:MbtH family protein [Paraburkholderia sediminicola]|uniref:MbtH family protein n=1 Tax=Paraburkholderia sediminicola TaxID=458836 RepID=UPI0038BBF039
MSWGDENTVYNVVVNHEDQYSIWPTYKNLPAGWNTAGKQGTKAECLAYIDEVWVDMRPLSLRQAMDNPAETASVSPVDAATH